MIESDVALDEYTGNGAASTFGYSFRIFQESDLRVTRIDVDGSTTDLALNTDYTVAGVNDQNGGTVVLASPLSTGAVLKLYPDMPFLQPVDFRDQGDFSAEVHEDSFDRVVRYCQHNRERILRALQVPPYETPLSPIPTLAARRGMLLAFDSSGNPTVFDPASVAVVTAYATTTTDAFDADGVQRSFQLSADPGVIGNTLVFLDGVTQTPDGSDYALNDSTFPLPNITFASALPAGVRVVCVSKQAQVVAITDTSSVNFSAGSGAVLRDLQDRLREYISVKDYGATGNGVSNDALAIAAANTRAIALGVRLHFPAGTYLISSPQVINAIGHTWSGDGVENTIIKAGAGLTSQLLELQSGSAESIIRDITLDTTGTAARCVTISRGQTPLFERVGFRGNLSGSLLYSKGDVVRVLSCKFDVDNANTTAITFDGDNQNSYVGAGTRVGSIGLGVNIAHTDGARPRAEGITLQGVEFLNTGGSNVVIGDSFLTLIDGCVVDQGSSYCVHISGGADKVTISDCWLGLSGGTGNAINIAETAGSGFIIAGNQIYGGDRGVVVQGDATHRVASVVIDGNVFDHMATSALHLDSVNVCKVTNNIDRSSAPASGSFATVGSHASGGDYHFDGNHWSSAAIAAFHVGSIYRFGHDTGKKGRNEGKVTVGSAATTLTVSHGLFTVPDIVMLTPAGDVGTYYVGNVTGASFDITWTTSGTPTWYWEAAVVKG